jgi:hypothetical protein
MTVVRRRNLSEWFRYGRCKFADVDDACGCAQYFSGDPNRLKGVLGA